MLAVHLAQNRGQNRSEFVGLDELAIGFGSGGKARRDPNALRGEHLQHFAERGVLSADAGHVSPRQPVEPNHVVAFRFDAACHLILPYHCRHDSAEVDESR